MKVELKDNKLYIEIDLEKPTKSSSGKTLVEASTHGNVVTNGEVEGKPVTIGLNAYMSRKLAIFVGTRKALAMAVQNQDTSQRQTALNELIMAGLQ